MDTREFSTKQYKYKACSDCVGQVKLPQAVAPPSVGSSIGTAGNEARIETLLCNTKAKGRPYMPYINISFWFGEAFRWVTQVFSFQGLETSRYAVQWCLDLQTP